MDAPRRMLLNAFSMNCVSHIHHGMWTRDDTTQRNYHALEPWLELATLLERGRFDALFLADVVGLYDTYRAGADTSIREAMQVPVNDPAMLIPAMATVTKHLGFAFTSSVLQSHPFTFARQVSTLDHLTRGRVGWNIVTSYLNNAATNLGYDRLPSHDERYAQADEYLEVTYKLWEASWDDDAVVNDPVRRVYADPAKIRRIDHQGPHYRVTGPHLSEPSPQRTPLLFQAGSSDRGRDFAARHAECIFLMTTRSALKGERSVVADIRRRAAALGRRANDLRFFQGLSPVVGATETEARQKADDYLACLSTEGALAHISGSVGVDLSAVDPDQPLTSIETESVRGLIKEMIDSAPAGTSTFRDLIRRRMAGQFLIGTPEQIADALTTWFEAGIDGFNLVYTVTPGSFADFVDGVVPVLQDRGLVQREYSPGTLRAKLFGASDLPSSHPARTHRFARSASKSGA
ncbi:MAG: LLM class flavin-dependent oxidoreductase [Pseudomonadota bacterium]